MEDGRDFMLSMYIHFYGGSSKSKRRGIRHIQLQNKDIKYYCFIGELNYILNTVRTVSVYIFYLSYCFTLLKLCKFSSCIKLIE